MASLVGTLADIGKKDDNIRETGQEANNLEDASGPQNETPGDSADGTRNGKQSLEDLAKDLATEALLKKRVTNKGIEGFSPETLSNPTPDPERELNMSVERENSPKQLAVEQNGCKEGLEEIDATSELPSRPTPLFDLDRNSRGEAPKQLPAEAYGYRQSSPRLDYLRTDFSTFNHGWKSYTENNQDWYKGSYMSLMNSTPDRSSGSASIMTPRPLYPHETGAYGGCLDTLHGTNHSSCHGCCAELQQLQRKVTELEAAVEQLSKKKKNKESRPQHETSPSPSAFTYSKDELSKLIKIARNMGDAVNILLRHCFTHEELMLSSVMGVQNQKGKDKRALDPRYRTLIEDVIREKYGDSSTTVRSSMRDRMKLYRQRHQCSTDN